MWQVHKRPALHQRDTITITTTAAVAAACNADTNSKVAEGDCTASAMDVHSFPWSTRYVRWRLMERDLGCFLD